MLISRALLQIILILEPEINALQRILDTQQQLSDYYSWRALNATPSIPYSSDICHYGREDVLRHYVCESDGKILFKEQVETSVNNWSKRLFSWFAYVHTVGGF